MSQDLYGYLVDLGWCRSIAAKAGDAYAKSRLDGVADSIAWASDHREELIADVKQWEKEVGEYD
ncbi:MAG: hypothetical protein ACYTG0_25155 [Planctomycetota bacterium]